MSVNGPAAEKTSPDNPHDVWEDISPGAGHSPDLNYERNLLTGEVRVKDESFKVVLRYPERPL